MNNKTPSIFRPGPPYKTSAKKYYNSRRGFWLHEAYNIRFTSPYFLTNWVTEHKPKEERNSTGYLAQCLSYGNRSVKEHLMSFMMFAGARDYYFSSHGRWLRRFKNVNFNNGVDLVNCLVGNKPANEDIGLSYYVTALSFGNRAIRDRLKDFNMVAGVYEPYAGKKGNWLKRAEKINFKGPAKPLIKWLIIHKPKKENNSLRTQVLALSFRNKSVREKLEHFQRAAAAYTYILKNDAARKNLNKAYSRLIALGVKRKAIKPWMLRKRMNKALFTRLRSENKKVSRLKRISIRYLFAVLKNYLTFAGRFLRIKRSFHATYC